MTVMNPTVFPCLSRQKYSAISARGITSAALVVLPALLARSHVRLSCNFPRRRRRRNENVKVFTDWIQLNCPLLSLYATHSTPPHTLHDGSCWPIPLHTRPCQAGRTYVVAVIVAAGAEGGADNLRAMRGRSGRQQQRCDKQRGAQKRLQIPQF